MIFTERQITVRKGKATIDEPVILYRGDFEVSIKFTIMESKFRFKSGVNLVDSEKASNGQLAILAPYGGNVFSEVVKCEDGTVTFTLTKEMIDQLEEVGLYSFQIRLFDYYRESRVSIPPVEFGIEVREPVASEDHDNEVNNAIVGYSIAKVVDPKEENVGPTFDANGNYNETNWKTGDRISEGKLNKIEDAIDKINQNEKNDVAALDKRVTNNFNVLENNKADKNEVNVERKRIDNLAKLPAGSTSGDAELIDARIDIFGNTHTNVGSAIRENFRPIFMKNEATNVCAITTKMTQSGDIVVIPYMSAAGLITVTIIDTDNIINMDDGIVVGVTKTDGTAVNNLARPGTSGGVCDIDLGYPIKNVRIWFDSSSVKSTGNVTINVSSSGINEKVSNHETKIRQLYDRDISASQSFSITASQAATMYTIPINIPANIPITITLESPDEAIDPMTNDYAIAGITNEWGTVVNDLGTFSYGNSVTFQINQNVKAVRIWFRQTSIKKDGELIINVQARSIAFAAEDVMRQLDDLRDNANNRVTFIEDYLHLDDNLNYGTYKFDQMEKGSHTVMGILPYDYKAETPIYITYKTDGNNSSTPLIFGCYYVNQGYLAGQVTVDLGETVVFTPSDDFTAFAIWAEDVDPGSYMVSIDSTNFYSKMADLQGAMDASKELGKFIGYEKDVTYAQYTVANGIEQTINRQGVLPYKYKKNEPFYITFSCDNPSAHSTVLHFGCDYVNWGYIADQFRVELNTTVEFIPPDDINSFNIWAEMASADMFILETHSTNQLTLVDRVEALENQNSGEITPIGVGGYTSFSIVGDSYSTFQDWLPSGNAVWYPPTGDNASNDVRKVQETWWWQLADRTGMTLFMNDSWSGSTICGTGYNGANVLNTSAMVTRVKTHMGQTKVLGPKPDVIFLFGGTNDSCAGSPVGSLKYSDWTDEDLMQVLPAFCSMVNYLQTWNPGCRIINITNTDLKADITNGLATACEYYGIENIQLNNVDKIGGHPSIAGMKAIADQIIAIL